MKITPFMVVGGIVLAVGSYLVYEYIEGQNEINKAESTIVTTIIKDADGVLTTVEGDISSLGKMLNSDINSMAASASNLTGAVNGAIKTATSDVLTPINDFANGIPKEITQVSGGLSAIEGSVINNVGADFGSAQKAAVNAIQNAQNGVLTEAQAASQSAAQLIANSSQGVLNVIQGASSSASSAISGTEATIINDAGQAETAALNTVGQASNALAQAGSNLQTFIASII